MRRQIKKRRKYNKSNIIVDYIKKDFNLYLFSFILFIIGICIGIFLVNSLSDIQSENIHAYISSSILRLKDNTEISNFEILKKSISKNLVIVLIIWILGLTFFGKFLLYIILLILGINFGYTISSIMNSLQFVQGVLFLFTSTFLQNIIFIPSIVFLCVQGIKIHNELSVSNNVKQLTTRFTAFCIIVTFFLLISSIIETYISYAFLIKIKKYL